MNLKTKLSISLISRILNFLFAFITSIIISRSLGPEGFGVYKYLILLIMTSSLFAGLGIFESNGQLLALSKLKKNFSANFSIIFGLFVYFLISVLVLIFITFFESEIIRKYFIIVFLFYLFFHIQHNSLSYVLMGIGKINEFNMLNSLKLFLVFLSILILKFFNILTIKNIIYIQSLTSFVYIALALFYIKPNMNFGTFINGFNSVRFKKIFKRGLFIYGGNISTFLNYRLDMFILKYFWGYSVLGIYSIAVMLVEKLWFIPESIRTILFLEVANKRKDKEFVNQISRLVLSFLSLLSLLLIIFAPFFIPALYSEQFKTAVTPFVILIPGVLFFSFSKLLASYFSAINKVKINTIASLSAFFINLVLNLLLIPRFSMIGAAFASTISYSFGGFYQLFYYKKITGTKLKNLLIVYPSDIKFIISKRNKL